MEFVTGLQRAGVGTTETRACIDGETAEYRFALHAALDREIAEGADPRKAERQAFAIRQRHRRIERHRAFSDISVARGARECHANPAFARGKSRAQWTDLDRRGEW